MICRFEELNERPVGKPLTDNVTLSDTFASDAVGKVSADIAEF